jgi:hypothetical protein
MFLTERGFDETEPLVAYWAALPQRPVKPTQSKKASGATERTGDRVLEPELAELGEEAATIRLPEPQGWGPQAGSLSHGVCGSRVSLEAEVPEALFDGMREFIRKHPQWDQYSVITSALADFLFLNGARDACVKDHYLAALFPES